MRLHYSADPDKNVEWSKRESATYKSHALWEQEQEIRFGVGGGERLLRDILLARFDQIVIRDEAWKPKENWQWGAGYDYGQAKPSAWLPICRDHYGCHYAVAEHYQGGEIWTPRRHADAMLSMTATLESGASSYVDLVGDETIADPSIFTALQAQSQGEYASIAELYEKAFLNQYSVRLPEYSRNGIVMRPGIRGDDLGFVNRLRTMWTAPNPLFKIVLHPKLNYSKKQEGTRSDGCPNLIWELLGIRRQKLSATQLDTRSPLESIVQKNNHAFDAIKYYFSSRPGLVAFTREEQWTQKAEKFLRDHPEMNTFESVNAQIQMRRSFDEEEKRKVLSTWK